MRIAIVGTGISGLGAAWALDPHADITLYEAGGHVGGHSNTVDVEAGGKRIPVDTGFIVYNEVNYPNLTRLFERLAVPTQASNMSFAASIDDGRFEYAGSLAGFFVQSRNWARPRAWRMIRDILRFYREAPALLAETATPGLAFAGPSLGQYLRRGGYSDAFVRDHLGPMAAAIWSGSPGAMLDFPARSFVRFFANHGLLQVKGRPQWRTVTGGSREYVRRLTAGFAERIRLDTAVVALERTPVGVLLRDSTGRVERYDQVVLATHADQALDVLGPAAAPMERKLLGTFRYERNTAVLHQDERLMPRRRGVWSSWNYMASGDDERTASVTYWMNRLQDLDSDVPLFLSLNPLRQPASDKVLGRFVYQHPQYDHAAIEAQAALPDIQGMDRVWFCGSYCGYGFHEDGLSAGLSVAAALGAEAPWQGAPAAAGWQPLKAAAE